MHSSVIVKHTTVRKHNKELPDQIIHPDYVTCLFWAIYGIFMGYLLNTHELKPYDLNSTPKVLV